MAGGPALTATVAGAELLRPLIARWQTSLEQLRATATPTGPDA